MIGPTPLLDSFKRGEVERDARLLAAQGTLAPRAYEQLAILVLLLEDPDAEIRSAANETLDRIPTETLKTFLARADIPIGMREFFADRGVFPDELPPITDEAIDADGPLVDTAGEGDGDEEEDRDSAMQKLAKMTFPQRLKAAVKGSREIRAILIRDPNKMLSAAVLSSPKLSQPEVESFARMGSVSEDVLRIIGSNRGWTKNYNVILGLTKNPKTPLAMSLNFMTRLSARDLTQLSVDRNVPEALRLGARKRIAANTSGRG